MKLLIMIILSLAVPVTTAPSVDLVRSKTSVSEVSLELSIPRITPVGQPIPLALTLRNGAPGPVRTWNTQLTFAKIEVLGSDDRPVAMTAEGLRLNETSSDGGGELGPGKEASRTLDLTRYFDLHKAGSYTLNVFREVVIEGNEYRRLDIGKVTFIVGPKELGKTLAPD